MLKKYYPWQCLPSSEELPDSDDTPVDNELQDLIPSLLKLILAFLWKDRMDWFFGIDIAILVRRTEQSLPYSRGTGRAGRAIGGETAGTQC
jgi:Uma2 family endonuclease